MDARMDASTFLDVISVIRFFLPDLGREKRKTEITFSFLLSENKKLCLQLLDGSDSTTYLSL